MRHFYSNTLPVCVVVILLSTSLGELDPVFANDASFPPGLTRAEYLSIQSSECDYELSNLPGDIDPDHAWHAATNRAWDAMRRTSQEDERQQQRQHFIICCSCEKSGYERRRIINDRIGGLDELPMYNGAHTTCFLLRTTYQEVLDSLESLLSADSDIRIQPLLPMMKIRKGTLNQISSIVAGFRDGTCQGFNFIVSININMVRGGNGDVARYVREKLNAGQGRDSLNHLQQTFPFTSLAYVNKLKATSVGVEGESIPFIRKDLNSRGGNLFIHSTKRIIEYMTFTQEEGFDHVYGKIDYPWKRGQSSLIKLDECKDLHGYGPEKESELTLSLEQEDILMILSSIAMMPEVYSIEIEPQIYLF